MAQVPNCTCGFCGEAIFVDPSIHSYYELVDGIKIFYCSLACSDAAAKAAWICSNEIHFPQAHGGEGLHSLPPHEFKRA